MLAVEGLCGRLERQQNALLAALEDWPAEHIHFRPLPDAWSAAQVLSHMVKVERGTTIDVRRALKAPGPAVTPHEVERAHRLLRWLYSPERVAVPQSVAGAVWPDDEPAFGETAERWRTSRRSLISVARAAGSDDRSVFTHPGSGAMDLVLVLRFLHAHTRHHAYQLERLRAAASTLRT